MIRSVLGRALFVAIGAAAAALAIGRRATTEPAQSELGVPHTQVTSARARRDSVDAGGAGVYPADIERRLRRLETGVAEAAVERHRLQQQLAAVAGQLAARKSAAEETLSVRAANSAPLAAPEVPTDAAGQAAAAGKASAMERALVAAGLDAATVADIKRRQDENTMAEITLRDRATREQWLDSPRFATELAAIEAQRTPLRTEIGDDAYDRYLFALGQTNRVRVDDVLQESPAAQAGLQPGDLIVRYGDARLFAPGELVSETRSGTAGEAVQLEIIRDGQRLEVQVPRGPLGLRVAGAQGNPETS
ncbi:MAG TPA: PDZ domain-containing protein [Candidatus Margulisiibacteriota bacterium]|nr:PDZ domain-containing protein [Candidatus Margulisiibacteriota bacterium]